MKMFKVICVDHVGIACKSLDVSKKFYTEVLGLPCSGEEEVQEQHAKTVFIPCGETLLELLVDTTADGSGAIGRYITKNGQGIQHMALRVDDIKAAIADVQAKGGVMIDKAPRGGAGGMDIAFVHPKSVGILLELCSPHKK
jgi:methylmalonyl-CoA/ethylmalonyl-CoA epimerase